MTDSPNRPDRQSIRMRDYDYSQPGYYCFTICIQDRQHLLGNVIDSQMQPSRAGQIVLTVWHTFSERYTHVELDYFQLMPNHVHGIIALTEPKRPLAVNATLSRVPQRFQPHMQALKAKKSLPPLGEILRVFKALSTYRIHKSGMPEFAWQDRYHESIIPTEKDLDRARHYIMMNPARWVKDPFNDSRDDYSSIAI